MILFLILAVSILGSYFLVYPVKGLAYKFGILDQPGLARKVHSQALPLMGGWAIFLSFAATLYLIRQDLLAGDLGPAHWLGFLVGGAILMLGGFLDDKYDIRPGQQFMFPLLAVAAVILGGVNIEKITSPFGGLIYLAPWASAVLIGLWLLGMMYTTKLLDGLDGLVTGVSGIGALVIFLFTMTTRYYQPDIGYAALALAGACLGFLLWNWHPARIFLGEGGSLFLGYALGVLAIISGGKIAIALLIMGIPILDTAWTIFRRLRAGQNPFKFADRKHLHFRLLDLGLSQRRTVLVYYSLATVFGLAGLFLQSIGKMVALALLVVVMFLLIAFINRYESKA